MNNELFKYWIWFSRIRISNKKKLMLIEMYNSVDVIFNNSRNIWEKCEVLNKKNIEEILNKDYRCNLDKYVDYIEKKDIKLITVNDEVYPQKLRNIYDAPVLLYCMGNINLLNLNCISIIGARNCSVYGKNISYKLAYDLAKEGICVVSGLAKGIDTYAHMGTLEAGGKTIAVIGNGLDYIYPYDNKDLYEKIVKNGGLIISEYVIGTKPEKINFPARNRIISGLSDGIVVVEAKEKSGTLITVDFGLEQGKDIFAVPGNINSYNSIGTNKLLKQGAIPVTSYSDILDICYKINI